MLFPLLPLINDYNLESRKKIIKILKRLRRTIRIIDQPVKGVFDHLDEAYNNDVVVTPLMFDLTYADDNEGTRGQKLEYRIRQDMAEEILSEVLGFLESKLEESPELKEAMIWKDEETVLGEMKIRSRDVFDPNNYEDQIETLEALVNDPANGGRVRPFFGVDPRRWRGREGDLIAEVEQRCMAEGSLWTGVKLYAPAGFSPTDKLLYGPENQRQGGLYGFCEENNIPITVHCSRSGFACLSQDIKVDGHVNILANGKHYVRYYDNQEYHFNSRFFGLNPGPAGAIKERARTLNHPKLWKIVLERFPSLRLNLAHWGNSDEIMIYIHRILPERFIKLQPVPFYEMHQMFEGEERERVKSHFTLKDGLWQLNEANWAYEASFEEDLAGRMELWDLLIEKELIDNWTKDIRDIIEDHRFTNVYTDLSCFTEMDEDDENDSIAKGLKLFKTRLYDELSMSTKERVLYGSDFWLNVMQGPDMKQYFKDFKDVFGNDFEDIASRNPERFLGVNQ